jgi:threonine synthase
LKFFNPFLKYRKRLDSYTAVRDRRLSDSEFVEFVEELDVSVASVGGTSFVQTPLIDGSVLAAAAGLDVELHIKAEPHNVGGSHKARHLFGSALHLLVEERLGAPKADRLAIASCGNAAISAALIAAAMKRSLDVFVPTWVEPAMLSQLEELEAHVHICPRREGETGDPAFRWFCEAVESGSRAFSVQASMTPTALDGGRTLGWEIADQLDGIDALYIQVGGGALANAVSMALPNARLHPVQSEGCHPLRRSWDRLAPRFDFAAAEAQPTRYMWAWESEPHSIATGILDDVTYDWLPLLRRTYASGGEPVVAPESTIEQAYSLAHTHTEVPVCATGSSGLAGLLHAPPAGGERVVVLFTGIDRA